MFNVNRALSFAERTFDAKSLEVSGALNNLGGLANLRAGSIKRGIIIAALAILEKAIFGHPLEKVKIAYKQRY